MALNISGKSKAEAPSTGKKNATGHLHPRPEIAPGLSTHLHIPLTLATAFIDSFSSQTFFLITPVNLATKAWRAHLIIYLAFPLNILNSGPLVSVFTSKDKKHAPKACARTPRRQPARPAVPCSPTFQGWPDRWGTCYTTRQRNYFQEFVSLRIHFSHHLAYRECFKRPHNHYHQSIFI